MDKFTEPEVKTGRGKGGCMVLFIAVLFFIGLAMWLFLWGRAAPTPKLDTPPVPAAGKAAG